MQTKFGKLGMIGDGKFLKSYLMRADGTNVIVKVYMKLSDEDLNEIQEAASDLDFIVSEQVSEPAAPSNVDSLPDNLWCSTGQGGDDTNLFDKAVFGVESYDRLLTRPFDGH